MSTTSPKPETPERPARAQRGWLLSATGVVLVAAILILVNVFFSLTPAKLDLTEHKVHSLSDGTRNIINRIDTDVSLKFFISPKDVLPPMLRPMVEEVEGWLARYRELKPEFIKVEKYEVEPASDEEEAAALAGIEPQRGQYFGIAATCLDRTAIIPFVPHLMAPYVDQDRIEFGISSAIAEVIRTKKKTVGLMSALQVSGNSMPFGPQQRAWALYDYLKGQYEVKNIELTTSKIDDDVDVLLVIHPAGITDEAQWAIDQYVLKGGRVIAFLDPYSFVAARSGGNPNLPPGMGGGGVDPSSNLNKLLEKWGYSFDSTQIVADMAHQSNLGGGLSNPLWLTLGTNAISRDNEVTKELNEFWLVYSGAFSGSPASGLEEKVLLKTSAQHQLVPTSYATAMPNTSAGQAQLQRLMNSFKPEGRERYLAIQLSGNFKTAFPEGKPAAPSSDSNDSDGSRGPQGQEGAPAPAPESAETPAQAPEQPAPPAPAPATPPAETPAATEQRQQPAPAAEATTPPVAVEPAPAQPQQPAPAAETPAPSDNNNNNQSSTSESSTSSGSSDFLKESTAPGLVILVADSDMLADMIHPDMILNNSNLPFALNLVDQAAGDRDLMSVRARGSSRRPFSALNEIAERAQAKIRAEVESLNAQLSNINETINRQKTAKDRNRAFFEGLRELQKKQREVNAAIYEKQKAARKEIKAQKDLIKWFNILTVPLLIVAIGLVVWIVRKARTSAR